MHIYAKFEQNTPCGSRVISILLTDHGRTDIWTDKKDSDSDYSADLTVVQCIYTNKDRFL